MQATAFEEIPAMDTTSRPEGRMSVSMVAEWRVARNLFPIYTELVRQSGQCPPPFSSFGSDDRPESLQAVRQWFAAVDASFTSAEFRERIEAIVGLNETAWHTVALHFLGQQNNDHESRNRLAYILVRYFATSCPPSFRAKSVTYQHVAEVMQPLIGNHSESSAAASTSADDLLRKIEACRSLEDLLIIATDLDRWEGSLGSDYFAPLGLVRATHLRYLFHLNCVETVQAGITEITQRLQAIRERGIEFFDCRGAGLGEKVAIDGLLATWTQRVIPADVEYRLKELVPELVAWDKVLGSPQRNASDPRVEAEISSLRDLAERLVTQLSSITQRIQRLESIIDLQSDWKPSAETMAATNRFRITAPPPLPSSVTMTPIAARGLTSSPSDAQSLVQPATPGNGRS